MKLGKQHRVWLEFFVSSADRIKCWCTDGEVDLLRKVLLDGSYDDIDKDCLNDLVEYYMERAKPNSQTSIFASSFLKQHRKGKNNKNGV